MLQQRHEEESVRMESDILKIKVFPMPPLSLCQLQAVVLQADMDVLEAELAVLVSETEDAVVSNPGQEVAIPSRYLFCDAEN